MDRDVLGKALLDYQNGHHVGDITTYLRLPGFTEPIQDILPLKHLFRIFDEMPSIEQSALHCCHGKVLDIGCGSGIHSLYLSRIGLDVTALDPSKGAIETCRERGLTQLVNRPIMDYYGTKFDTLLLLMNGIGVAGRMQDLKSFLFHLKKLLTPGGQILADSSDILYMYQDDENCISGIPDKKAYYGEGQFIMEYRGEKSLEFPWLYIDYGQLQKSAEEVGLACELVTPGPYNDYLARLF